MCERGRDYVRKLEKCADKKMPANQDHKSTVMPIKKVRNVKSKDRDVKSR